MTRETEQAIWSRVRGPGAMNAETALLPERLEQLILDQKRNAAQLRQLSRRLSGPGRALLMRMAGESDDRARELTAVHYLLTGRRLRLQPKPAGSARGPADGEPASAGGGAILCRPRRRLLRLVGDLFPHGARFPKHAGANHPAAPGANALKVRKITKKDFFYAKQCDIINQISDEDSDGAHRPAQKGHAMGLITKLFGTTSEREVKRLKPIVDKIEALEPVYQALSDDDLRGKTEEFRALLAGGKTLDDILPDAFAAVREAAWRVLGMKPYRVQLIGGLILHQGRIAEMKTGEGKTLVAILPAYLNALSGEGVHIVTVNDYLAKRDSEWMGKVYRFMGLKVGLIIHDKSAEERRAAYQADITYCTNNELGFDYLRDNMAIYKRDQVQRGHSFAIVDEVDSILIDEARTPLIISGQGDDSSNLYSMAPAPQGICDHRRQAEP